MVQKDQPFKESLSKQSKQGIAKLLDKASMELQQSGKGNVGRFKRKRKFGQLIGREVSVKAIKKM